MSNMQKQSLVKKRTLTTEELVAIQQLAELCNQHEQLNMRIDWSLIPIRSGAEVNDFLYYHEGVLVGYLMAYGLGTDERELTGMVHPELRRQGIARALLQAARDEYTGFGVRRLLLISERRSSSGKAFVEAVGASKNGSSDFSEHEMLLTHFQQSQQFDDRLLFRRADLSDLDALVTISSAAFDQPAEGTLARLSHHMQDPHQHYYLATFGEEDVGCHEPVGCLRVEEMDREMGIYGFAILPDYQGRGYGRQMLEEAILAIRARSQKPIMLDVETTNERALRLYRSCGFDIKTTYDYYNITL